MIVSAETAFDASSELHENVKSICGNLNYLSRKDTEIKVGVWAATQQRLWLKLQLHVDTEQADKACLIGYLFGSKAANLWGHPVIFPKLLEGWGVCARYHCHTLGTLSKHAICWDKMEAGSAGSQSRQSFGWFMQRINANHEHIL